MYRKTWLLYGLYAAILTVLFFYLLFPSQSLKNYIVVQAGKMNPGLQLSVKTAELEFPFRIRLDNVDMEYFSDRLLEVDRLVVSPRLRTLIGGKSVFAFTMNAHQGVITGTADVADGQRLVLDAVASEVQLADIPFMKTLSAARVGGILNGSLNYAAGNGRIETLNMTLAINGMTIALAAPFFTLDNIQFDSVEAEAVLQQNQQLKISQVTLTGDQIQGKLSGYASLGQNAQPAMVHLSGTVMPQERFMQDSGFQIPPTYLERLKAGGGIPIRISGPINDLRLETR